MEDGGRKMEDLNAVILSASFTFNKLLY